MKFEEMISNIREVRDDGRLVIFVGAGVSANSGFPSWSELIAKFSEKLAIEGEYISQDDYLKIPQYFYTHRGSKEYFEIIATELNDKEKVPNAINNILMRLNPKHFITTNYDHLIEKTMSLFSVMYSVIKEDKDLLLENSNKYIIKMHGDIDKLETIVLKEDDYLNYSVEHPLIENYIKALFSNHSFLFVGYSLSDYNLKLIMGWIKHMTKIHGVTNKDRPKNYLILNREEETPEHIEKYYEDNNIYILSTFAVPKGLKEKNSEIDLNDQGKGIYSILDCILDKSNDVTYEDFDKFLFKRYKGFEKQNRVAIDDLLSVYQFKHKGLYDTDLIFFTNYEESKLEFNKLRKVIESSSDEAALIKETLLKAGIEAIVLNDVCLDIKDYLEEATDENKFLRLEQDFAYEAIKVEIDKMDSSLQKAYCLFVINPYSEEINKVLEEVGYKTKLSFYEEVILKFNQWILFSNRRTDERKIHHIDLKNMLTEIPKRESLYYGFLRKIYFNNWDLNKNDKLFTKFEKRVLKKGNAIYFGSPVYDAFFELKAITYNYYFYLKENFIMLDFYKETQLFFEAYVKAIFCTYAPLKKRKIPDFLDFDTEEVCEDYVLNSVDLDIIIRYTNKNDLSSLLEKYKVDKLAFENKDDVIKKFTNLCNNINYLHLGQFQDYLSNFLAILAKMNLAEIDFAKIIKAVNNIFLINKDYGLNILNRSFEAFYAFINSYQLNCKEITNLLYICLDAEIYKKLLERNRDILRRFFKLFAHIKNLDYEKINKLINSYEDHKCARIVELLDLFGKEDKQKYINYLKENITKVNPNDIIALIWDNYMDYTEEIENHFLNFLNSEQRTSFPNPKLDLIENVVILKLVDKEVNIAKFKKFKHMSATLDFMIDPNEFDYAKIQTSEFQWINFLNEKKYRDIILNRGKEQVLLSLKKSIDNGYATTDELRLYYKYFAETFSD